MLNSPQGLAAEIVVCSPWVLPFFADLARRAVVKLQEEILPGARSGLSNAEAVGTEADLTFGRPGDVAIPRGCLTAIGLKNDGQWLRRKLRRSLSTDARTKR